VAPTPGLQWLVEAAEPLRAFVPHCLHAMRVPQGPRAEVCALLSAVQAGEVSAAEAIERLERAPPWGWVAMDPERKVLRALDVGDRPLAMAPRVGHHVAQVLAPAGAPRCLPAGCRA
jgi:hypothetical protein